MIDNIIKTLEIVINCHIVLILIYTYYTKFIFSIRKSAIIDFSNYLDVHLNNSKPFDLDVVRLYRIHKRAKMNALQKIIDDNCDIDK